MMSGLVTTARAAEPISAAAQTVIVDGASPGRTFDGVGALSAGASSRLLIDYPEPQRGQVLDYLFKPGYGAALQILKVEIGGDTDSTDGAEPSHQRTPTDLNCGRGYEWWLMEQAKQRNPGIVLSALAWGAPNWTRTSAGTVWSGQFVEYLISWLNCAKQRGLTIEYLGGWNEKGFDAGWYKLLRRRLNETGFGAVKVSIDDSFNWNVVSALGQDPALAAAVDVVSQHYVCGYLVDYTSCPSTPEARALGKPLHSGETGSLPYDTGAASLVRAMNRQYIDGAMTSTVNWSVVASFYDTLPFAGVGLMKANEPWSGAYVVGESIWAVAHTTQFTQPGWRFLDSAKGYLSGGGSVVSLRSPSTGDYSTIVETLDATAAQDVTFQIRGGLGTGAVRVWSSTKTNWFNREADVVPVNGSYTIRLEPGRVYSISTTTGQGKGAAQSPTSKPWKLPYRETFDSYPNGRTPRAFSDIEGAFETAACRGRQGTCLEQKITAMPVQWGAYPNPATIVGDPLSWHDYSVSVDALPPPGGWSELVGRIDGLPSGIQLRLHDTGRWEVSTQTQTLAGGRAVLASGTSPGSGWRSLGLQFNGQRVFAFVDGRRVAAVIDTFHQGGGQVGLATSPWHSSQFDNLFIELQPESRPAPNLRYVDPRTMTVTGAGHHLAYRPHNVLDGSIGSIWHSQWLPLSPLPQSVTFDLGSSRTIAQLSYLPRQDGNLNGAITGYDIATSTNGSSFSTVTSGNWAADATRKVANFSATTARFVRLTAVQGVGGFASGSEVRIAEVAPPAQPSTVRNPVREHTADPFVFLQSGTYHLADVRQNLVTVASAPSVTGLGAAAEAVVWTPPASGDGCCRLRAPRVQQLNGLWYLYYTADNGTESNARVYVLEASNPMGPYTFKARLDTGANHAADGAVLRTSNGQLYLVWSSSRADGQHLFIAAMTNPWTVSGSPVLLSRADQPWEQPSSPSLTAPAPLLHNGKTFVAYSAGSCSSPDAALGTLHLTGTDPVNPSAWTKLTGPRFGRSDGDRVFGVRRSSFFTSPDGTQTWMAYVASTTANGAPTGSCDDPPTRIGQVAFDEGGIPVLGRPAASWYTMPTPAGDPGTSAVPDGVYKLLPVNNTANALDVAACSAANGANVQIWTDLNNVCQEWNISYLGDGTYKIISNIVPGAQQSLDVTACSVEDHADVAQWPYWGGDCQQWYLDKVHDDVYRISSRASGRALDVDTCSPAPGADVRIWPYWQGTCQQWHLVRKR